MLRLNIEQQYAKLAITSQPARLTMHSTAPQLAITTEAAVVEITNIPGKLTIDQSPCRASLGLKSPAEFARDQAEAGRRTALETVGRIAAEGDRLANIESKEDAIVNMAAEANLPDPPEITLQPIAPPQINYQIGRVEYNPQPGKVAIKFTPGSVQLDYQPGQVNVRIAQYQSIRFWTTENKFDQSI